MNKALILAGGLGKRMNSPRPKVVHEILGKPLINWVIDAAIAAGVDEIGVVIGYGADEVRDKLPNTVKVYIQRRQLGTADAVKSAMDFLDGRVVILYGDAPLVRSITIKRLIDSESDMSVLTSNVKTPKGYGRIVKEKGKISEIVEDCDASDEELKIREINSGMYSFESDALKYALLNIKANNKKGEYYLTDAVNILLKNGKTVDTIEVEDETEILGANSQKELADLSQIAQKRILDGLMNDGVTIEDPSSTFIGPDAQIESGAILKPFTFIYGKSKVAFNAIIGPQATLKNTYVGEKSAVLRSDCDDAIIGKECSVGPFSRLRPGTILENGVKIGNFVEIKNSHLFRKVKAQHLTYLGDASIGEETNVGAGTITCNYDGVKKSKTLIGKHAFIGSNSALVAPVEIGERALIAAGSVITENVPAYALAFGRARQKNKKEWVLKKMEESHEE